MQSMKKHLFLLLISGLSLGVRAQDSASFLLHKFAQNIGRETYAVSSTDSGLVYTVHFKFTDRGQAVPLNAELRTTSGYDPLSLFIKGSTSRSSTINDSIRIRGRSALIRVDDSIYTRKLPAMYFPVGGYSPGTVQMILLKYWNSHGRPETIPLLPTGALNIKKDGYDTLSFSGKPLLLERYVISGLIWGNELAWTDAQGNLLCLITNDAEMDKLEMMLEPYESLLPELISRAATYGMRLFTTSVGGYKPEKYPLLAVVGGDLVDVTGKPTIKNSVILIEDGLIKKTGTAAQVPVPVKAHVIHAEGMTILPGLWDMHAHFEQAEWGPAYLAEGVTTVRDCGNEFEYINAVKGAIDNGTGIGPHILKAGIIDGPGPMGLGVIRASTPSEAIAAVRRYKDNGFVQIKIYSSIQPPIVKVICDEAHRLGLTVTGHIPEGMTLQQGVDSGMDMVNHVQYVLAVMKMNKDYSINLQDSVNQQVLQFIAAHHVVIDPTVGVYEASFRSMSDDITRMEPAFYSYPLPLQVVFRDFGMPAAKAARYKPLLQSLEQIVKALYDEGAPVVAGTDQGLVAYSLDRELQLYVDAGLTPLEAIRTATLIPAGVMHQDAVSGTLEPGKKADLIIVQGDPLTRISELRNVKTVIKDGQVYDPVALRQLVGFAK